jgi:hypothetical protein
MANKSFQSPSFAGVTSEVLQAEDGLEQLEADNKRLEHVASLWSIITSGIVCH